MALMYCRECGKQVSSEAPSCPHCGVPNPTGNTAGVWPDPPRQQAPPPPAPKKQPGCFGVGCLGVIVIGIIGAIAGGDSAGSGASSPTEPHSAGMATVMCESFVKERLKAPRTAKFPWGSRENAQHLGEGKYRVRSYVDAQNGFGALIRSNWDCTIQHVPEGDRWQLENLTSSHPETLNPM
jgi:hypothetical protein